MNTLIREKTKKDRRRSRQRYSNWLHRSVSELLFGVPSR